MCLPWQVFLNINYINIIKIPILVTLPRNAKHILAQLLRNKSILNHEQFHKRTEYTGVAFYPVSILWCHLYFGREVWQNHPKDRAGVH